ncbi:uncharacterized protein LOC132313728 [Cornus florida]|uniref:uncharacterized protein LOC132313728 n=1 Tax=Cornus florida TaxID=4283 RepID=UPI0028976372|nr:uncharacterized protein LOC132313728 [Cornus florida]XP_059668631.1 uncharacterized protein LOC132313728 [Cornus florida]
MADKQNILSYRGRLDKTLASHDLANEQTLKTLVKNQLLRSCSSQGEIEEYFDSVVEKRTKGVSDILNLLKSAANVDEGVKTKETPHGSWKLKQDNEEYRVMYREGPEGTPFHTLLVEGFIDGPIDVCLCITWESTLYKKWWPQSSIPSFKLLSSDCLQKVRIGEQISLVRMKVSWPLSTREAVVHFFEFEYLQDDLIIVLFNSIPDMESINKITHGFSKDGIPDAKDVVRIDVVGGFAVQKVTPDRSYFRTIANMDVKLDFVPPSLINFVSRQLVGSGFRLYQKEVASVYKGDQEFGEALKDPMYTRIREALCSENKDSGDLEPEDLKSDACILHEEQLIEIMQAEEGNVEKKVLDSDHAAESFSEDVVSMDHRAPGEIEEVEEDEIEESRHLEEEGKKIYIPLSKQIAERCCDNNKSQVTIRPEVEQALGTLEKVISIFKEYGFNPKTRSLHRFTNNDFQNLEESAVNESKSSNNSQICSNVGVRVEASKDEMVERTSYEPRNSSGSQASRCAGSNSYSKEANHNRIAPVSPDPNETHQTALCSSEAETTNGNKLVSTDANGIHKSSPNKGKNKKARFCCFNLISG